MKNKIALILSWWWMRAVFCVGALTALVEKCWYTNPDIVIAWSWSSWTASYFVARQYKDIKKIRLTLLSTKKFINFWRIRKIMDIDYLIDIVFKQQAPLRVKQIEKSSIDYYIATTNSRTGKVEYFSPKNKENVFELMRASKAFPFFYGKSIPINGKYYHDGSNSSWVELHIHKALSLGANKIIVIDSYTKFSPLIIRFWLLFKSHIFSRWFMKEYIYRQKMTKKLQHNKNILFCSWSISSLSALDNNISDLKIAYLQWYNHIVKNKNNIEKFLLQS